VENPYLLENQFYSRKKRFTKSHRGNDVSGDKARRTGLIVFDVEGVLVPKKRFLYFAVGRTLRFSRFLGIAFYGFLYEVGLISLKTALSHVFKVFKGMQVRELMDLYKQIPVVPEAAEMFRELRIEGWKTALISSGLPDVVVKDLGSSLEADYSFGIELKIQDDIMTGEISGDVIEDRGKLKVLRSILAREELLPEDCAVVADDRNNSPLFLPQAFKIGYNPDFLVKVKADVVLSGKLPEILSLIRGEPKPTRRAPAMNEIVREAIHASGFFVPIIAVLLGLFPTALLISVITLLFTISEARRMERASLPVVSSVTRAAATQPELYEFATAPIFFALGILLTLLLFPSPVSSVAIAAFCLGDSTASLFGGTFGKRTLPFNKGKTLEGSVACFFFDFCGAIFFTIPTFALLAAVATATIECLPWPVNDNFVTPLLTGLVLVLMQPLL
jgi:dolichol kinase/phosphoserine phosphatase